MVVEGLLILFVDIEVAVLFFWSLDHQHNKEVEEQEQAEDECERPDLQRKLFNGFLGGRQGIVDVTTESLVVVPVVDPHFHKGKSQGDEVKAGLDQVVGAGCQSFVVVKALNEKGFGVAVQAFGDPDA